MVKHREKRRFPLAVLIVVVAVITVGAAVTAIARNATSSEQGPGAPAAAPELTGPPTLYGRVVDVPDPATVVVEVQGQRVTVQVIGLDTSATPACADADALTFARSTLLGQPVTLVPDPTLPPSPVRRAYVVLASQLSYTDAAIRAGWASAGDGLYRPVFVDEERVAQEARVGMWGPPCNRPAP